MAPEDISTVRTAAGLRDVLFEELDNFRSGKRSVKHAQTVVNIARTIIDSSRLEILGLAISNAITKKIT